MDALSENYNTQMAELQAQLESFKPTTSSASTPGRRILSLKKTVSQPTTGPRVINRTPTTNSNENTSTSNNADKKAKIPPIFCYNLNVKELVKTFPELNLHTKLVNSNCCKVFTQSIEDYVLVKDTLATQEVDHYSFAPKSLKPINLIIKNLDSSFEPKEVEDELKAMFKDINFLKVTNFQTKRAIAQKKKLNMWLVQVQADTDISELRRLNRLLHSIVTVEQIKGQGVIQCFRCQRFDHLSMNCGMALRCVKCGQAHTSKQCPLTKDDPVVCINCKENHVASFRGCRKFKEHIENKNRSTNQLVPATNRPQPFTSTPVRNGVSFAQSVTNSGQSGNRQSSSVRQSGISFFNNEIMNHFGCDMSTVLGKINAFLPVYENTAPAERKFKLLEFMFEMASLSNDTI